MKVLMINSVSGYGSTGSICEDIASVLENQGHECYIAYGQSSTSYPRSFKIGTKIENHYHNIGSRLIGKQGYFSKSGTKNLISYIENVKPDIIHLHNLHGNYLNLQVLFEFLIKVQIPIVYTLHDCWAFTGKCAHFTDVQCYKWKIQCYSCPQLKKYPPSLFFDYSKEMYVDKKNWFTSIQKMNIIPVSNWLASQAEESFLKKYPITPIYNWVNHSIFKETIDREVIKRYNIDENKFTIVLVGAIWDTKDVKWQDALKLATMIDKDMQILMIGNVSSPKLLPKNIKHIPYVNGKEELAKIYSISDVYIHLSTEDTFGKVIAEALSCGTPAIVYNSTACPEIIDNNSGFVVEKRNVKEVFVAVSKIKEKGRSSFSKHCRERVIKEFDLKTNIDLTIQVYKKMLKT